MPALTCPCCCSYSCCNWPEATYWQDVERNEESDIKTLNKLLNWVSSSHFKHLNNQINKCTVYLDSQRMRTRSSISFLSTANTTHVFSQNRAQALIHRPWRFICCCLGGSLQLSQLNKLWDHRQHLLFFTQCIIAAQLLCVAVVIQVLELGASKTLQEGVVSLRHGGFSERCPVPQH